MNRALTVAEEDEWITSSPALEDLTSISPLILDVDLRTRALARYDEPKRLVAEDTLQSAARLMQATEWQGGQLLGNLGCRLTVNELKEIDLERLQRCQDLLRLISKLTGLVDTIADRRSVVIECAGLLRATRKDARALEQVMTTSVQAHGVSMTPIHYIRLGEIAAAAELAREIATPGDGTQGKPSHGPFGAVAPSHLSTTRIEMYLADEKALGAEVSRYVALHIQGCAACGDAIKSCQAYMSRQPQRSTGLPYGQQPDS